MIYYTVYLGNEIWENCIDDMNQSESWGMGGMVYTEKQKALDLMEHLKTPVYGFEDESNKFSIKELRD